MVRFRLTPGERRARVSEGRWGWASPKRMSRREFIGLRDRMYKEKRGKKEDAARAAKAQSMHAIPGKKRGGKLKWLILLIIVGTAVYFYLKKTGRI